MPMYLGDKPVSAAYLGSTAISKAYVGTALASENGFSSEASALFSRMSIQPSSARKTQINALIKGLKDGGVWSKLDGLYVLAAHDAQAARLNWVADLFNIVPVAAPTFTVDRGYQGDGASSYLSTGFNPFNASVPKFVQDSAHIGAWSRTDLTGPTDYDFGGANARLNIRSSNASQPRGQLNDATLSNFGATSDSLGHYLLTRTTSAGRDLYRNGLLLGNVPSASAVVSNTELTFLKADASNFSRRAQAVGSIGAGLSAAEASSFYAALSTYLNAIGAV